MARRFLQILARHKDEERLLSFLTGAEALDDVVSEPTHALMYTKEHVYQHPEYRCDLVPTWEDKRVTSISMTFPKGSPYFRLINFRLGRRLENGLLAMLNKRSFELGECTTERIVTFSFYKSISLFGIIWVGMSAALMVFLAESYWFAFGHNFLRKYNHSSSHDSERPVDREEEEVELIMRRWNIRDRNKFLAEMEVLYEIKQRRRKTIGRWQQRTISNIYTTSF